MTTVFQKVSIAVAMGASVLAVASPAQAQRYGGYHGGYHGRDNGGTAIVAGIAGLAIGAALASNNDRGRYYDRGYDDRVVYEEPYYAPAPIYRGYDGYYEERGYYRDDHRGYDRGRGYYRGYGEGRRGDYRR